MIDLQTTEMPESAAEAHQVTFAEFAKHATVEELQNHGRKWRVVYDTGRTVNRFETFSDAASTDAAIADAHHIAVNNALYNIEADKDAGRLTTPPMPPGAVLNEYPELVHKFGIDMARINATVTVSEESLAQRQLQRATELGAQAFLQGQGLGPTDNSELVALIARRAVGEPSHQASTSELAKAYTSAWMDAELQQIKQFMAIDSIIVNSCAGDAAEHLRNEHYGEALAALKSGEQEAVRPTDQETFARMAGVLETNILPGETPVMDSAARDHLIADIEQFRTDMKTWIDETLAPKKDEPATGPGAAREAERRVIGDTEMLVIRLRDADEQLRRMETGSNAHYSAAERAEITQMAISAMHPERFRSAIGGATLGADNFNTARVVARNIANTMAAIDGPDASNPFAGTTLEQVYGSAQRWNAYITRRDDTETLQQLLNMRSTLVDYVEISSMALYEAQQHESRLFVRVKSVGGELPSELAGEHHLAVQTVKDATLSFKSALDDLRQFRNHPTDQPELRREFQEVESLELVIAKTEQSIEAAKDSGLGVNDQDRRELKEVQTMLKAFLQKHDATIPLQSEALLSTVKIAPAVDHTPQQAMR